MVVVIGPSGHTGMSVVPVLRAGSVLSRQLGRDAGGQELSCRQMPNRGVSGPRLVGLVLLVCGKRDRHFC